ncbi:MAG: hypothetical protein R3336_05625, partial [Phycisphaeraceae bacterium]|nr:hypothetical protein [Phycisphaeraceae bacterium]
MISAGRVGLKDGSFGIEDDRKQSGLRNGADQKAGSGGDSETGCVPMIRPIVRTNYRYRWLHLAAWAVVLTFYVSWLYGPLAGKGWSNEAATWYLPHNYLGMVGRALFSGTWLMSSNDGILPLLTLESFGGRGTGGVTEGAVASMWLFVMVGLAALVCRTGQADLPARARPNFRTVTSLAAMAGLLAVAA